METTCASASVVDIIACAVRVAREDRAYMLRVACTWCEWRVSELEAAPPTRWQCGVRRHVYVWRRTDERARDARPDPTVVWAVDMSTSSNN